MDAPSHFFTAIMGKLDQSLLIYVDAVTSRMISYVMLYTPKLFATAVCMYGYAVWRGTVQEPLRDGVYRFARIAIIIGLIDLSNYHTYIADLFLELPDRLAAVVSGNPGRDSISFLDTLWDKQQAFADAFWQKGLAHGISGIGFQLIALLLYGVNFLTTGGSATLLIIAKCGLSVWVAVGPVFVILSIFDATKQFTNAWLGQVITFGLIPMLTGAVIYLIQSLCLSYISDAERVGAISDPGINQVFPLIYLCVCAGVFLKQIPSMASGLGGGVAVSSLGVVGAAMKAALGGAGIVKNLITGKTLDNMRGERKHRAMNKEWAKNNPGMTMRAYRAMTTPKNKVAKT